MGYQLCIDLQSSGVQAANLSTSGPVSGSSAPVGMGPTGGQKHVTPSFEFGDREVYKCPRVDAYVNATTADIDSYRRQHEVSALVWSCCLVILCGCPSYRNLQFGVSQFLFSSSWN